MGNLDEIDREYERATREGRHPAPHGAVDTDFPISQLRIVTVTIKGAETMPSVHYMHESQVAAFVRATVKLHHEEGNPHIPCKLDNLAKITVRGLGVRTVTYWWAAGTLQNDGTGARMNDTILYAPDEEVPFRSAS